MSKKSGSESESEKKVKGMSKLQPDPRRGWANFEPREGGISNVRAARVAGVVPAELRGTFFRNGPGL